jgi:hypothetical protein
VVLVEGGIKMARGSKGKPRQIAKGAQGPANPQRVGSKISLPGQVIPGNKVPKSAGVTGNPKVKRPVPNTTGSTKIKGL